MISRFFILLILVYPKLLGSQVRYTQDKSFIHYTSAEGLPFSSIIDITQDEHGFMWILTRIGICRFDGINFKEIEVEGLDGNVAILSNPKFIKSDDKNEIYILSSGNRIIRYHRNLAKFVEIKQLNTRSLITSFHGSKKKGYWVCYDGRITHLDSTFSNPTNITSSFPKIENAIKHARCLTSGENGELLFLALSNSKIIVLDRSNGNVESIELSIPLSQAITKMENESTEFVWLFTEGSGAYRVNLANGETELFSTSAKDSHHVSHDFVRAIVKDKLGHIWIGTEKGLCVWNPKLDQMEYYQYDKSNPKGLNSNAIYSIYCDRKGDIWIGTYFGGLNLYNSTPDFFKIISEGVSKHSLSGRHVSAITEDQEGNIYVGLEGNGFNRINRTSGEIDHFFHIENQNSLSYDNVHSLIVGPDQLLYIGTYTGGFNIYDPTQDHFTIINNKNTEHLPSDNIYCLLAKGDTIFIGTDLGIAIYNVASRQVSPFHANIFGGKSTESLCITGDTLWVSVQSGLFKYNLKTEEISIFKNFNSAVSISFVEADKDKNIWIGDNFDGLRVYWAKQDSLVHYSAFSGFPAKRVYGMVESQNDYFWISSSQGLIKFFPKTQNSIVFNQKSGLPATQFNYQAYYKSNAKDIYFGSINGLVYFNEDVDYSDQAMGKVVITDFEILNEVVEPATNSILKKPIHLTDNIQLAYDQKAFTIHFSALDYTHPGRVQYAYLLQGFDTKWNLVGNEEFVNYTNLSPGKYTFHVKASYDNTAWDFQEATLGIEVKPPWWLTKLAYFIYGILIITALLVFYLFSVKIEKSKSIALLERKEKENSEKINEAKLEFFTNISHELRTPLTLILGPLSQLLETNQFQDSIREKLRHIYQNTQRLMNLINQLIEFRKIENGHDILQVGLENIVLFSREVKEAFEDLAEFKHIQFEFKSELTNENVYFDHKKLERILFNLLTNAFKFTPVNGKILFQLKNWFDQDNSLVPVEYIEIIVKDTGQGIPKDKLNKIFTRFYKIKRTSDISPGSGIGLAFTKSLVSLHKGNISVESKLARGTTFTVTLPVSRNSYSKDEIITKKSEYLSNFSELVGIEFGSMLSPVLTKNVAGKPILLIVDDNPGLLAFLHESLQDKFNIQTALNGKQALKILAKSKPDLIISDVMMPEMSGLELTQKIKESIETSHIPVILLTAKTEIEHHAEGLSSGADFYIEKPFYPQLLIKHIENVLATRRRLISLFKKDIQLTPTEITHSKSDREFMKKLTDIIEKNIENPEMDISFLLKKLFVSRSLLHLKLKKIVNCSATEYIRTIRLKKAAKYIISGEKTITEAAYASGFSSPSLFSRRFKEYFHKTPREYLFEQKKQKNII